MVLHINMLCVTLTEPTTSLYMHVVMLCGSTRAHADS